jgi:tetratricopeptide (TPR) repeat protein
MNARSRIPLLFLGFSVLWSACASLPRHPPEPRTSGEYLARGTAHVDAAQKIRIERSPNPAMGNVFGWPPDLDAYQRHYAEAASDFRAILERFPGSPEAPEAQFQLGRIHDHPHLNDFDEAISAYRRTVERYPGTQAAEKAQERIRIFGEIRN